MTSSPFSIIKDWTSHGREQCSNRKTIQKTTIGTTRQGLNSAKKELDESSAKDLLTIKILVCRPVSP
jgi:hypothetical protein